MVESFQAFTPVSGIDIWRFPGLSAFLPVRSRAIFLILALHYFLENIASDRIIMAMALKYILGVSRLPTDHESLRQLAEDLNVALPDSYLHLPDLMRDKLLERINRYRAACLLLIIGLSGAIAALAI
jgi:hypothetical protein